MLTSSSPEFLDNLRAQTSSAHKNLEHNRVARELLSDNVSIENYITYLSRLYGIVYGFEKAIFPTLTNVVTDLALREKVKLATDDLKIAGVDGHLIKDLPTYAFSGMDIYTALGAMYVIEGSTLGNRFIFRHVKEKLWLTEKSGASYFFGYGHETMAMWNDFIRVIEKEAVETGQQEKLIGSALKTYQIIDTWLAMSDTR